MSETRITTLKGNPFLLAGKEIVAGEIAPDFTALDNELTPKNLSDYDGKVKIISVFPSIDTPVCSIQNVKFNKEAGKLKNTVVLAISNDLPFALSRYCSAEGIDNLITLSDHKDVEFGMKYGFLIDELRLLARGVVVIDTKNVVQYVQYVSEVGDEPDYDAAIEAASKCS